MTPRRRLSWALAAGVLASGLGCGYSLGAGPGLASVRGARTVQVGPFENLSFESDAALVCQRAVERELAMRGATKGDSPATLVGRVDSLQYLPVGVVGPQDVRLWRADLRLSVELREPGAAGRRIASASVSGVEDYRGLGEAEGTEVSRRLAFERLAARLAGEALDRLAP